MAPSLTRIVAGLALVLLAAGCGQEVSPPGGVEQSAPSPEATAARGDVATWQPQDPEHLNPTAQGFMIEVTRLGCASGTTGEVLEPQVVLEADRIVIRTDVAPIKGDQDCQGNDAVPIEIQLEESLGGRDLVDDACLSGEAVGTAACEDGAVRWTSPARGATAEIPDWTAPAAYSFVVQSGCGERSFIGRYAVEVTDGAVTSVRPLGGSYEGITPSETPTLDEMLAEARAAQSGGTVEVAVDKAGIPRWISADPLPNAIDDESCYAISEFHEG